MKTLLAVLSLIPGLRATPPLPPRTTTTDMYKDFEATLVEKYAEDDEGYSQSFEQGTCYKVNVKNTGEGYIKDIHFTFDGGYRSYRSMLEGKSSNEYVIAPNQEATFVVSANYNTDNFEDFEIIGSAYTGFTDELTVIGSKTITTNKYGDLYYYYVDMSFGHIGRDRYCYGAIIKAYQDDKETYFVVDEWNLFSFSSTKEVKGNENNEVEIVKTLKTEYIAYGEELGQIELSRRFNKGCNGSIVFGVPAAASLGLVTTFVVALHRSIKKNKSK